MNDTIQTYHTIPIPKSRPQKNVDQSVVCSLNGRRLLVKDVQIASQNLIGGKLTAVWMRRSIYCAKTSHKQPLSP